MQIKTGRDKIAATACAVLIASAPIIYAQNADIYSVDDPVQRAIIESGVFSGNDELGSFVKNLALEKAWSGSYFGSNDTSWYGYKMRFRYGDRDEKTEIALDEKTPDSLYRALKMENYLEKTAADQNTSQEILWQIARSGKGIKGLFKNPNVKGDLYRWAVNKLPEESRNWWLRKGFESGKIEPREGAPGFEGRYYRYLVELDPAYNTLKNPNSNEDEIKKALQVVKRIQGTETAKHWNEFVVNQKNKHRAKPGKGAVPGGTSRGYYWRRVGPGGYNIDGQFFYAEQLMEDTTRREPENYNPY